MGRKPKYAAPPPPPPAPTAPVVAAPGQAFAPDSPWNQAIPATAKVDPNSAGYIANLARAIAADSNRCIGINLTSWTVPVYTADASTPRFWVAPANSWWSGVGNVPIPADAMPDPQGDGHLVITDGVTAWEFWQFVRTSATTFKAGAGAAWPLSGPGYSDKTWNFPAARAYGGSLLAGLIRREEIFAGVIPHALAFAYPYVRGQAYAKGLAADGMIAIGSHCDNASAVDSNTLVNGVYVNIPEGARFRLKPSVDVLARFATSAGRAIGTALQTHGAFTVDRSGAPRFYAENPMGRWSWSGLLDPFELRTLTADDFEVLTLPPLTPATAR